MDRLPDYYRISPDGRTRDLRYRFRGGTRLRVTAGPHQGATGTMDTVSFDIRQRCPVYVLVDSEPKTAGWIRARWDELESAPS